MKFYPSERIALFVDGANLYATAKALGFDIDYKRLLTMFGSKGQLIRALYYTAISEELGFSRSQLLGAGQSVLSAMGNYAEGFEKLYDEVRKQRGQT